MRALVEAFARISELERKLSGMVRHGPIAEVDPAAGTVRLDLGAATGGGRMLSPAVPYSQMAGGLKAHIPPTVGQQMTMISPSGDWRQAVAVPLSWGGGNASPSAVGDENVITYGGATITLKGDALSVVIGGVSLTISADGLEITGGKVTHDGKDIGSSHIHGGVITGPGTTTEPAN
jgi:phage baseplate assembly protein gpV